MTDKQKRKTLPLGHMIVETIDGPNGKTFAFYANEGAKGRKVPAFSAHIQKGMGAEMRRIAAMFDDLEKGL